MNKILIDFTYYQNSNGGFHGGGEYGDVIINQLLLEENLECGIFYFANKTVNTNLLEKIKSKKWMMHPIWNLLELTRIVIDYKYDVLYSALPYDYNWEKVKLPSKVKFIGTFHGMRELELSILKDSEIAFFNGEENLSTDYIFLNKSVSVLNGINKYEKALFSHKNRVIVTVSEHTKNSLKYYFPQIGDEKIYVLYSPNKGYPSIDEKYEKKYLSSIDVMSDNYGLIVSAGIYYKNGLRAIIAYDNVFDSNYKYVPLDYKVLVLGLNENEILNVKKRIRNIDRFIFRGYQSAQELEILYKNAHLFVYPSLNEGFGYPPLEAMKYNTICICSSNSSITEVCGDMVLYFNPLLIDEIAIRIIQSFDLDIRAKLKERMLLKLPDIQKRQEKDLIELVNIIKYS